MPQPGQSQRQTEISKNNNSQTGYLKKGVGDHRLTRRVGLYEVCKDGPTLVRRESELCGKSELHRVICTAKGSFVGSFRGRGNWIEKEVHMGRGN